MTPSLPTIPQFFSDLAPGNMAQAVLLTPKEVTNYYRQQELLASPDIRKLTVLDQEMSNIINRNDLSANQKLQQYEDVLNRFHRLKTKLTNTHIPDNLPDNSLNASPQPPTPPDVPQVADTETTSKLQEIMSFIQSTLKQPSRRPTIKKPRRKFHRIVSVTPANDNIATDDESDSYMTASPDVSSTPMTLDKDSTPAKSTSTSSSTPDRSTPVVRAKKRPVTLPTLSPAGLRLLSSLGRDPSIQRAFNIMFPGSPEDFLLPSTVKLLTDTSTYAYENATPDDIEKATKLFDLLLEKNVNIPRNFFSKYPVLRAIGRANLESSPAMRSKMRKKYNQSGAGINFKRWNTYCKRLHK